MTVKQLRTSALAVTLVAGSAGATWAQTGGAAAPGVDTVQGQAPATSAAPGAMRGPVTNGSAVRTEPAGRTTGEPEAAAAARNRGAAPEAPLPAPGVR